MKGSWKRVMSGVLSVLTIATTVFQPITTYAAEPDYTASSFESQYPELETVKDKLAEDEIVTANDYTVEYGSDFDIKVDFSGIEGINDAKVKVELYEAKNDEGQDFDTGRTDTYKAVYKVESVSGNPSYRVSRNVTVREPETEAVTMANSSGNTVGEGNAGETEDTGTADDGETDRQTETEVVTDLTEESETTTDEETGLTVSDVMEQAGEEGIDLYSLNEGESVTFMAREASTQSTKKVTVTRGACYQYSDYGYGSYLTYQYTVKFGSVSATAYCIQPEKSSPGSGTYDITKLSDGKKLAKVCYYGTKASGDDGFFTEENGYGNLSTGARFILVHLAASYANSGDSAFSGASSKAKTLAMKLYNYCISQPEIPDVDMSFSDANVTAYVDGNSQRTKEITFKADELQSITMKLPSGVKLHNVTTGKTSKAGEAVEISGGTKFYLSAPLTQVSDVAGSWSATMKGSITKDYSAYKISTGSGSQDLALVFGEGVDDEKYVDFKVTWVQYASVKVIKKDSKANAKLSGAVFGLYSDADCKNLITKLPATDVNGEASVQIVKTQDTVYLKEITAPSGYRINATAYNVKLEVSKTTTVTVPDEEQLGQLTVYKEGEVLTGADVSENGTTFRYEKRRQKGAVYNVYAGADITTAYGTKVYSNFVFILATPLMIFFILYAKQCIFFLSGIAYKGAIIPMKIIMPTLLFIGLSNLLGIQILIPMGKEKIVLYSEIAGAITDLIFNSLLIPIYSASGAAIGTVAAELVVLIVQYVALKKQVTLFFRQVNYVAIGLGCFLASLFSYWVIEFEFNNFITLFLAALIFFGVYLCVLLILKEEFVIEMIKETIGKPFM